MDWVHCNNCFFLPGMGKRFFLTSCGHLYCADCISQCATDHCKLCGNTCSSIPLSSQMKPDVEMYFYDPLELLKKYMKEVQKVAEFQNSHRTRLFTHQRDTAKNTQLLKDGMRKAQAKLVECESEKQKMISQIEYLKQLINMNQLNQGEAVNSTRTPKYTEKDDSFQFQSSTPMSKWSQSSSSTHSRNRSGGSSSASPYPAMPARVSLRTPPIDGKLGVIPGTPLSAGINFEKFRLSSHGNDPNITPKVAKGVFVSPMSCSPCHSVNSVTSQDSSTPYGYRYSSVARSSPLDDHRSGASAIRQIRIPNNLKTHGSIRTLAVQPYSPDTSGQAKK